MSFRSSLLSLLAATSLATASAAGNGYYRAAVVDYEVLQNNSLTPRENLMNNVLNYNQFLQIAKSQEADIIVFPEGGLLGSDYSILLTIPDPSLNIVPNGSYDQSLQDLSGYAKTYGIYLAVNVLENYTDPSSGKSYKYNTNIVFDRNGSLIARYRKFNLYGEPVDRPDKPEYSVFKSDFNVTFGQFICFDILFKEPALTLISQHEVYDFIYPSAWFSELPFLTSVQTQWSWAVGNNVTLLSAGLSNKTESRGGSGIFRGKNALNNLFTFSDMLGSTIMVGDVPIRNTNSAGSGKGDFTSTMSRGEASFPLWQQPNIDQFNHENITLPNNETSVTFKRNICHEKLCCDFDLTVQYVNPTSSVQYKAVVFDGKRTTGGTKNDGFGLQVCGIVLCSNGSISSCGSPAVNGVLPHFNDSIPKVTFTAINIKGNFITDNANPLPNVLLWPSNPSLPTTPGSFLINTKEVQFSSNTTMSSLIVNTQNQIITVAIHSRVFSRDPGNSAPTTLVSLSTMLIAILPFLIR
uniref:Vanin-like protein 2 n=1 Tax=Lygus hesperus TaxID=30085 RepID=A0A146KRR8_LYGHE